MLAGYFCRCTELFLRRGLDVNLAVYLEHSGR